MANKERKDWREERRKRGWAMYQAGWKQKDIAEALGVSEGAVSQWIKRAKAGGEGALAKRKSPGAPRRMSTEDRQRLPELLEKGAEAFGFRGDLWTCPRVAKVIQREFGVSYHPAHVSRILKEIGWTPQRPIRRAKQRNAAEVERWEEEVWPEVKKKPRTKAEPSFS